MAWDNFIDELKLQVNIVDVVGREVDLKKASIAILCGIALAATIVSLLTYGVIGHIA